MARNAKAESQRIIMACAGWMRVDECSAVLMWRWEQVCRWNTGVAAGLVGKAYDTRRKTRDKERADSVSWKKAGQQIRGGGCGFMGDSNRVNRSDGGRSAD